MCTFFAFPKLKLCRKKESKKERKKERKKAIQHVTVLDLQCLRTEFTDKRNSNKM